MAVIKLPNSAPIAKPQTSLKALVQCYPTIIPGAKITFCGEAPGRDEIVSKRGFTGSSGRMLRAWCSSSAIDFDKCNLTNVVKRLPPGNDFDNFYLDGKKRKKPTRELEAWRELLVAELSLHKPNILVALGNEALRALVPESDGVTKWRGSILESSIIKGLKVIPEVHPSFVMRDNWHFLYICKRTFRKVAEEAKAPQRLLKEPEDEFIIRPTIEQALDFIKFIKNSNAPWYLDVETVGDSLRCFGLSSEARPRFALCIPIQTSTGPYWSVVDEAHIWRELSRAAQQNPYFRNQNAMYDIDYLLDMGVEPAALDFDPMIGMNVAYPEFPKGLDFTTTLYTYYPYYKDEGKTWNKKEPDEKTWVYNCKDMVSTPKVSNALIKDLKEKGLFDVYQKRSNSMFGVALEMQRNRLRLDPTWYEKLSTLLNEARESTHKELVALVGNEINVKSTPEVGKLLFDKLKLPSKFKRGSSSITTDEKAIKELRATFPNVAELNLILRERHLRTKLSNYIDVDFDTDPDGNRYLAYQPFIGGTKTARWSFTTSPKWRGSSPQTIAKVMRLMYVPPQGSVFWQRDLSQAEARIVAWLAACRFLLDVFASPIKIHKVVGARIFKKTPDEILSDSLEYDISKRVVHAYNYMMRYRNLAIQANLPLDFAKFTLEAYGKEVPEIDAWHQSIKQEALTKGRLVTPMGRVRECFKACGAVSHTGQLPEEILRDLVSYIPQSTVPDLVNQAMVKLWNELPWAKWHQQGHDSYLASGPAARTQQFYELAEEAANIHFTIRSYDCHIPGEFQWGYNWGAMLKYIPGEDTSEDAWRERAEREGYFELEGKNGIKNKLISLLE